MPMISNSLKDRTIGAILVDSGRLSVIDAERILRLQKVKSLRFGDAAIQLGILSEHDIQFALASQFDYPYLLKADDSLSPELVAAYTPFAEQVEILRSLRSQLMLRYLSANDASKSIAVLSADRKEGKSFLAANLAVVFSQLGERTLLIDANMRNPRQQEIFKGLNSSGLSSILSGRAGLEEAKRIPALLNLSVLPAGSQPPNPQELIGREQFSMLLEEASRSFDVIIVDTPAVNDYSEALTIAVRSGGAIIAARKNVTRRKSLEVCAKSLDEIGVSVVGSVLNYF